jgi:hypothetical protein
MNEYVTDYDKCLKMINKPILLAEAYAVLDKNGKSIVYDPTISSIIVTEYRLSAENSPPPNHDNWYYYVRLDLFFEKIIESQATLYDLYEAIEMYNTIDIKNHNNVYIKI